MYHRGKRSQLQQHKTRGDNRKRIKYNSDNLQKEKRKTKSLAIKDNSADSDVAREIIGRCLAIFQRRYETGVEKKPSNILLFR